MFVGVLLLVAAEASAPPAAEQDKVEEIVVTGERAKRSLKDTPSSVAVIGEQQIDAQGADRLDQLLAAIPNLQLGNGSEGPTIRGQDTTGVLQALPAFLGGARSRGSMEVDGRTIGYQEFIFGTAPVWDVSQVEVFRSPLTVTHGPNSIAGGIVVTTNDPTYTWQGRIRGIAGNFSTRQASALISGPLIEDQLAFRVAGDVRHARTTSELGRNMRGADPNDDDYSLLRLKLLAQPKALPGLKLLGTLTHNYSQMPQVVDTIAPFRQRGNPLADYGIYGVHTTAATLRATQQVDDGEIEAIVSAGRVGTRRYAPPGVGESRSRFDDFSGDLFGSWRPIADLTLRGGVRFNGQKACQFIDLSGFILSNGSFRDRQHSFGVFAEAEFAATPRLTLSAGGRYQTDRQRRIGGITGLVNLPVDVDERFSAWLPKLSVSYALTAGLKAGALVEKAYNPGGATLAFDTGELDPFDAETLWDYELFVKGRLAPRLSIVLNTFHNDIRKAQHFFALPFKLPDGTTVLVDRANNIPKVSSYGAEAELAWRAKPGLTLSGGLGLLRNRVIDAGAGANIGREFERGPHVTGSAALDWAASKRLQLSAQLRYHSGFFSDDFGTKALRVPSAAIIDARAAYALDGITFFAYAHNALNSFRLSYVFLSDPPSASLEDPRVVGVGVEAHF